MKFGHDNQIGMNGLFNFVDAEKNFRFNSDRSIWIGKLEFDEVSVHVMLAQPARFSNDRLIPVVRTTENWMGSESPSNFNVPERFFRTERGQYPFGFAFKSESGGWMGNAPQGGRVARFRFHHLNGDFFRKFVRRMMD